MSDEELDLDSAMSETMDAINERDDDDDTEQQTEAPTDDSPEASGDEGAVDDTEEPSGEDSTESDSEEVESEEVESEEVEEKPSTTAPTAYSAAAKDDWAKTPKSVQDAAIKREIDSAKGVEMIKEKATFGESLSNAASPYMPMIQAKGSTLEQFIIGQGNTMHALEHGSNEQKMGVLRGMAQMAGVDLASIPPPSEIEKQLAPYTRQIQTLQNQINQQNQQTTSQQDNAINQAITVFEAAVGENGSLEHPYFRNVEEDMIILLPQIRQQNPHFSHAEVLKHAYDKSIWANPETRQQLQTQQGKKADEEHKRKAKAVADKARKANKVNLRKKGQPATSQADTLGDIDDIMAAQMKEINSR